MPCPHGIEYGSHGGITQDDIDSWEQEEGPDSTGVLEFYSACDCCDILMHHSCCGESYFVMDDGRTLCSICVENEEQP